MSANIFFLTLACLANVIVGQTPYYAFGLYTISMGTPNLLNVYGGQTDGSTVFIKSLNTTGSGVTTDQIGIQSQNPIVVSEAYAASVNPGSNSVTFWQILPKNDPSAIAIIQTVDSGGDWPVSVALSSTGEVGCVVNSGPRSTVSCYDVTYTSVSLIGTVTLDVGSLSLPPVSHTGPSQISFTPDQTALIVAVKNGSVPLVYIPLSSSFTPSQSGIQYAAPQGEVPFAFEFSGNNALVLVDAAPYGSDSGVISVSFSTTGNLAYQQTAYQNISDQQGSCWIAYAPTTSQYFAVNTGSSSLTEVSLSNNNIAVGSSTDVTGALGLTDITVATWGGSDYLFVLATRQQVIHIYKVGAAGSLTAVSTVTTTNSARGAGVGVYVNPKGPATTSSTAAAGTLTGKSSANGLVTITALTILAVVAAFL